MSSGTGGLRPEYLTCLAEIWSDEDMAKLEEFGMRYLNGQLPTWFYRVWLTVTTVPLHKTIARTAVRPIGIRPSLSRAIHKVVTRATRPWLQPLPWHMGERGGVRHLTVQHREIQNRLRISLWHGIHSFVSWMQCWPELVELPELAWTTSMLLDLQRYYFLLLRGFGPR